MGCVFKRSLCLVSLGVLCFACGGCASPGPATPSFAAMPGWGKSYEAFQRDDQYCQSSAQQAIGYQSPGQAANQAAVGTAAVGTALGAAGTTKNTTRSPTPRRRSSIPDFRKAGRCLANARQYHLAIFNTDAGELVHVRVEQILAQGEGTFVVSLKEVVAEGRLL
jgi:hypothetical protein